MIFPTRFERTLIKNARRDCRENPAWRWRARINRICRWGERILGGFAALLVTGTAIYTLLILSFVLLSGVRMFSGKTWIPTASGQLLPLALLAVASLGSAGRLGYSWRQGLAKFKFLAIHATLPFPDRKLFAEQRNMMLCWSVIPTLLSAIVLGVLALQAQISLIGWFATLVLLFAQWAMIYHTSLAVCLLLERPRRNSMVAAGLFMMAINSLFLAAFGPYQADHAQGLAGFAFTFLPTGWIFGAFYYGVLHAEWRGLLFMLPTIAFLCYARRLVAIRLRIFGFIFDQPSSVALCWFPIEELENERRRNEAAVDLIAFRTRELPAQAPWQAEEIRLAMFPFEYYEIHGRLDRWFARRTAIVLESACGNALRGPGIFVIACAACFFLLFDWFLSALSQGGPSLVRSLYLAGLMVPNSFSRSTNSQRPPEWLLNLQCTTCLPFAWRDLMLAMWRLNLAVVMPVLVLAIGLAGFYCYRYGVPLHVAVPGYLGFPYVMIVAPWLWIVPPIIKTRPWRTFLILPCVGFYFWVGLYPISLLSEMLHPTFSQYLLAVCSAPVTAYLFGRLVRYLYSHGWVDLA